MNRIKINYFCKDCQNKRTVQKERKIIIKNITKSKVCKSKKHDKIEYYSVLENIETGVIDMCLTCVRKAENNYLLRKIGGYLYG